MQHGKKSPPIPCYSFLTQTCNDQATYPGLLAIYMLCFSTTTGRDRPDVDARDARDEHTCENGSRI